MKSLVVALMTALIVGVAGSAALAEPSGVPRFTGSLGPFFRAHPNVAVPAYHVIFITQQQGTAAGNISTRVRLNAVLAGVDVATMRRLTNEAHADFLAQLRAAGVEVLPSEQARALANGLERVAGNGDIKGVGAGITIGRSVRRGYAAFGAEEAPMLTTFHNPTSPTGMASPMAVLGAANTIGRAAREANAAAIVPMLTIDFINMEARRTSSSANVDSEVVFSLRRSSAVAMGRAAAGPGYQQNVVMDGDVTWSDAFATIVQGGAEVREGTMTPVPDGNYIMQERARGDAIIADPAAWEELVRQAFRAYNAALVAEIVEARR
jgi:hypothetical protein